MSGEPSKNKAHGKLTCKLAMKLRELFVSGEIDKMRYGLFVDPHRGNPHLDLPARNADISPHLGGKGANTTLLSHCDIMIADAEPRRAVLLIEVEENPYGAPPKTILGDVLNVWMAKAIRCKEDSYELRDTRLWVVVLEPTAGGKSEKNKALQDHLNELREPVQKKLHGTVGIIETKILRVVVGRECLVEKVVAKIKEELPQVFLSNLNQHAPSVPMAVFRSANRQRSGGEHDAAPWRA